MNIYIVILLVITAAFLVATFLVVNKRKHPIKDIERYSDGAVKRVRFLSNGKLSGEETLYYPDGSVNKIRHWKRGRLHGPLTVFYPNGQPYIKANYINGALDGEYTVLDNTGKILEILTASDLKCK